MACVSYLRLVPRYAHEVAIMSVLATHLISEILLVWRMAVLAMVAADAGALAAAPESGNSGGRRLWRRGWWMRRR